MNETIKLVLEEIESNGFEAYIVGGYVRDHLLGRESFDVDICTNALPKDIASIFPEAKFTATKYGAIRITGSKYIFDITTYRQESKYVGRRPTEVNYINNLMEDIKRRDFTINSICMNKNGEIIDLLDGMSDVKNSIIKIIGDPNIKFREDPLRILRALRFSICLNFTIEKNTLRAIKKNIKLIRSLSYQRKKDEFDIILNSHHALRGLDFLKKAGVLKYLDINYKKIKYSQDILGMWAQMSFSDKYPFMKNELETINDIRKILSYDKIDNEILFTYGLYNCFVAGGLLGINKETINLKFQELPINTIKDINITSDEIVSLLEIKPSKIIKIIYENLKKEILSGKIENVHDDLIEYIKNNKGKWL